MLQKYTFDMLCEESGAVRGLGGSEVHGLLFKLIKENDAARATLLHDTVDKPFALGPLTGIYERKKQFTYCHKGEIYSFSVSCLNQEMTKLVERIARIWPGLCVRLGSAIFTGNKVIKKYPAGLYYGDLFQTYRSPGEITFEFITPTSFRQQGAQTLFPLPERVFSSLLHRWNCFSSIKFHEDTDFSYVLVKKYNLCTQMVHFEKYMIAGFIGRCTYVISKKYASFAVNQINSLARFAEFAGVGYKVMMGMGLTKIVY